jgi:hypothetical protein
MFAIRNGMWIFFSPSQISTKTFEARLWFYGPYARFKAESFLGAHELINSLI